MKLLRLTIAFTAVILSLSASAQTAEGPALQINKDNRTISVSASDHAEAEPDVADLNVGFTVYGATLKDTYKLASDSSNAIVKAMLDAGATRPGIQSQTQRVSRLSDFEIKQQKGMKYSVRQSWTVSVAPKEAALILDAAVQAGANQSGDITWRLKDSMALEGEAIRKATDRAHRLAVELARGMGVTIDKALYATNTMQTSGVAPMRMRAFAMEKIQAAPAPLAIESQRVTADATVQIIYSIE